MQYTPQDLACKFFWGVPCNYCMMYGRQATPDIHLFPVLRSEMCMKRLPGHLCRGSAGAGVAGTGPSGSAAGAGAGARVLGADLTPNPPSEGAAAAQRPQVLRQYPPDSIHAELHLPHACMPRGFVTFRHPHSVGNRGKGCTCCAS